MKFADSAAILPALLCLALAGCMETPAPTPSPAKAKLDAACQAGDTASCTTILQAETAQGIQSKAALQQAYANIGSSSIADAYYAPQRARAQRCTYNAIGQTVYQNCN